MLKNEKFPLTCKKFPFTRKSYLKTSLCNLAILFHVHFAKIVERGNFRNFHTVCKQTQYYYFKLQDRFSRRKLNQLLWSFSIKIYG